MNAYRHPARVAFALLTLLCLPHVVPAAEAPTVGIQIDEKQIRYGVLMPIALFDTLVGRDRKQTDSIDADERARARASVEKLFRARNPVKIDGIVVGPTLEEIEFLPSPNASAPPQSARPSREALPSWLPPEFVEVGGPRASATRDDEGAGDTAPLERIDITNGKVSMVLIYGTKGRPRHVSVVWRLFPEPDSRPGAVVLDQVRAGLVASGDFREILFTRDEPEFIWHALEAPGRRAVRLRVSKQGPRAKLSLPVASFGLLVGLVVALVAMRRLKADPRIAIGVCVAVLTAALATSRAWTLDIPLPEGQGLERPGEKDAKRIFETLHRNIYRAFDYKTESDIYDALAQSVDGDLLDEIYSEVYTSLVMRDSGGVVCRVQSVRFLDIQVDDLEGSARGVGFGITSHWRVNGSVTHWGHTHFRTNEYKAKYSVEPREGTWKITGVSILQHSRIDDGSPAGGGKPPAKTPETTDG